MASFQDINKNTGLIGLGPIPSLAPVAAFNPEQIENLLRTKGILAFHAKHSIPYDVETLEGGKDLANSTELAMNYYDLRPILVVPQQFSVNDTLTMISLNGTGSVVMNITGEYLDQKDRVFVRPRDLIILNPTMTDMHSERFQYKGQSPVYLHYKVRKMDYLACASQGRMEQDKDFSISSLGGIEFVSGMKVPKVGEVVSAVYEYFPIFVIRAVPHSIRVLPGNSTGHGGLPRQGFYGPQFILADRSVIRDDQYATNWWNELESIDWSQWLPSGSV